MSAPDPAERPASRSVLLIVFTTILIDFAGFSVLIPVLPLYAEKLGASPLQVGLILTVYALAQVLFLPIWGWVSDRVGRRPVILVSLFGTVLSFVVLSFADTIGMIYLARALAGFFAASIGTAQAVVTDVTPPDERARGMGFIGAAFGAGMVIGPVIGGIAATFDDRMPFYVIAVLAGANWGLAWAGVPGPPRCTFRRVTDLPCPSCGATRATLAVVRGHPVQALGFNPLFCVVATAAAAVLGLRVLGGRGVSVRLSTGGRRLAWGLAAIVVTVNWAYVIWRDGGQA